MVNSRSGAALRNRLTCPHRHGKTAASRQFVGRRLVTIREDAAVGDWSSRVGAGILGRDLPVPASNRLLRQATFGGPMLMEGRP